MGPEIWNCGDKTLAYSTKSDVWSAGITMWEILNRSEPYPNVKGAMVSTIRGKLPPPLDGAALGVPGMSTHLWEIQDVLHKCLAEKPEDRTDIWEANARLRAVLTNELADPLDVPDDGIYADVMLPGISTHRGSSAMDYIEIEDVGVTAGTSYAEHATLIRTQVS